MAERDRFELDLAAAVRAHLEDAPTQVRPTELARQFATAYPHRRGLIGRWGFGRTPALASVLLLAGLLLALVVGGLVAGSWRPDHAVVIAPSPVQAGPTPGASAIGSMMTARFGQTATLLADGRVLITGGDVAFWKALASAELYDPTTGTFSSTGAMEMARSCHEATTLADGRVLIVGGGSSTTEIYDPKEGTFSPTGSLRTARCDPTATLLTDGRVLVVGGLGDGPNAKGDSGVALTSAELYDPKEGTFSSTGSMETARWRQTATLLADGRVLVAGGEFPSLASAELWDPKTGTFRLTGSMTTAGGVTATRLLDGRVLITGGGDGSKAEVYDPTTGTFKPTGSMETPRWQQTATLLRDGRILVTGGADLNAGECCTPLTSAELYDPTKGTFSLTGSLTTARRGQTATLLADARVLIVGGLGQPGVLASAELYDPASGTFGPTGP